MISPPNVLLVSDRSTLLPVGGRGHAVLTSFFMTTANPSPQQVLVECMDSTGGVIGSAFVSASSNPVFVDVTQTGQQVDYFATGTFADCSSIKFSLEQSGYEVIIDNLVAEVFTR